MPDFDYTMERLSDTLEICVTRDHRFGTDAFLLSDFAKVRRKDLACDLGTGCGIIPLLWFRSREEGPKQAYGVDVQPLAIEQLKFTVAQSGLSGRMVPVLADLSDLSQLGELLTRMFTLNGGNDWMYYLRDYAGMLVLCVLASTPFFKMMADSRLGRNRMVRTVFLSAVLLVSVAFMVDSTYSPFLYFNF